MAFARYVRYTSCIDEEQTLFNSAEDRQAKIVSLLRDDQFVDIRSLTERLQVSVATIRRDLGDLEEAGLLRRTHGGAVSTNQVGQDPTHAARLVSRQAEKAAIGATAAAMIMDGDAVILDAGTTSLEVAKRLNGRRGLTAISNGSDIVTEMIRNDGQTVFSIGGQYTESNRSFRGPLAEMFIRQFNADKLILNASSIDLDRGLICTASPENAAVQKAMIEVSSRIIVVADHTKLTKSSLAVTTKIEDVAVIVTDVGARSIIETAPEKLRRKFVFAN
jgi:DeoR family transcriptional regulator, repressor of opine catabolism and conjugal transfer